MGFYVRTSLRAGPFRFNLSGAGIGVSVGVPGFRVGAGPRGNYVRVGGQGVYYRSTVRRPASAPGPGQLPSMPRPSDVIMEDVTGATIQELQSVAPSELVAQLQAAMRRWPVWPFATAGVVVVSIALGVWGIATFIAGVVGIFWLALRDQARRSVVVMYDVTDQPAQAFNAVLEAAQRLRETDCIWQVTHAGAVTSTYQYKVNSGAGTLLGKRAGSVSMDGPRNLVTNIAVPTLACGDQAIHFLPDRILIRDGKSLTDMAYQELQVTATTTRFIEDGRVPRDSRQVGTTWKYVNVKGGPDRRFKNNWQLPVMLYGRLVLASRRGLNRVWDVSRPAETLMFAEALRFAAAAPPLAIRP